MPIEGSVGARVDSRPNDETFGPLAARSAPGVQRRKPWPKRSSMTEFVDCRGRLA
jgi:hypothetical protein